MHVQVVLKMLYHMKSPNIKARSWLEAYVLPAPLKFHIFATDQMKIPSTMRIRQTLVLFSSLALLTACTDSAQQKSEQAPAETDASNTAASADCKYAYQADSTQIDWTAFKFNERTGVGGTFDRFDISGLQAADDPKEVFKYAKFSIPVASVNSNNADRDRKILKHFFGSMAETATLSGQMIEMGDESAAVAISMNNRTDTVDLDLNMDGERVSLSGTIEMSMWDAVASIDSLNTICYDLHKGADGISKLWPDVELSISTVLEKQCP